MLALPGVDLKAMLRLTLAQAAAGGLVLYWFARTQRAVCLGPVHQALLLGPRDNPTGPPPPLGSGARRLRLPENTTYRTVACILLVPLLDALGADRGHRACPAGRASRWIC